MGDNGLTPCRPEHQAYLSGMNQNTEVLYNDTCPVCRFEIDHYRKGAKNLAIRFDSLSMAPEWGISPDQAARRLHVMQNGTLFSGMDAFRVLWSAIPRYAWLSRVTGLPIVRPALDAAYDQIAAPILYRAHLRRINRSR